MWGIRWSHLVGLLVGAGAGALVAALGGTLGYALSLNDGLFWGAVTGGILAGVPQFIASGAVLTRRENRALNLVVGVVGGLVVLALTMVVAVVLARLFF